MARPKTVIDWKKVDRLLEAGCPGTDIAASFGIHEDTLYRACDTDNKMGFAAYSAEKRKCGDNLLRAAQFRKALKGDNSMLIWLGKNRLDQSDKSELRVSGSLDQELEKYVAAADGLTDEEIYGEPEA